MPPEKARKRAKAWTGFEIVGQQQHTREEIVALLPVELGTPYPEDRSIFERCRRRLPRIEGPRRSSRRETSLRRPLLLADHARRREDGGEITRVASAATRGWATGHHDPGAPL